MKAKTTNSILFLFLIILSFSGCKEEKKETVTETGRTAEILSDSDKTADLNIEATDYEIAKVEDQSRKAMGKKSLSQYETSELEELPTNKKVLYKIILSEDIKENQVVPTVSKIVDKLTADDSDIDEIILWLYSSKEVLNNPYDIGSAVWAPNGELGNVDANIAKNNVRENYKIEYQINPNLKEYLEQKSISEVKFGLSEDERKQVFKDIVSAEDKASEYEQSEQDKVLNAILEKNGSLDDNSREKLKIEYNKISEKAGKIRVENKSKVFSKYKITEEQAKEITVEGLTKNWPLE